MTHDQVKQWKRACEVEIAKRGLQFHDMGHGWIAEPYGLDSTSQWAATDQPIPEEAREHLALIDGKRELYKGVAMNTNLCMSNPKTRTIMAQAVADYAQTHQNVSYVHVWLADNCRNHCECEECQKLNPSDYYVMIMNELDEELTRRNLDTRIVFLAYVDTMYAPLEARIQNSDRFALLYAPIQRSYTGSVHRERIKPAPAFLRNKWTNPVSAEESAAFLLDWQKGWKGVSFSYEYHFIHSFKDPGMMAISRRIYEDIVSLKTIDLDGLIEDGSQRPFFPNGFAVTIFAEALLNRDCDYDKVKEDYFRHAYGGAWSEIAECLERISQLFDHKYMEGESSKDRSIGSHYNPAHVPQLQKIREVTARTRELAKTYFPSSVRVQTISMRLLLLHADFCDMITDIMIEKALGNNEKAHEMWLTMCDDFGRYEFEIERYCDHLFATNICPLA